jgi:Tol biopolymer transport system component
VSARDEATVRPGTSRLTVVLVAVLVVLTAASGVVWWNVVAPPRAASAPAATGSPSPSAAPTAASTPASAVPSPGAEDDLPRSELPLADDQIVVRYNVGDDWTMSTMSSAGLRGAVVLASGEQEIAPVVSHDRRTVLYLRRERPGLRTSLHAVAADGSVQRLLFRDGSPGCPFLRQVVWSGDGTLGVVCKIDERGTSFTLGTARTDGTFIRTLDVGLIGSPTFSPDGRQILYPKAESGSWSRGGPLYLTAVDGSTEPTRVVGGRNVSPAWAPTGTTVAFSRYEAVDDRDDPAHVVTMPVDGSASDIVELTSGEEIDTDPSWSPDGRALVFRRASDDDDEQLQLVVVSSDGEQERELSHDGTVGTPSWTPRSA